MPTPGAGFAADRRLCKSLASRPGAPESARHGALERGLQPVARRAAGQVLRNGAGVCRTGLRGPVSTVDTPKAGFCGLTVHADGERRSPVPVPDWILCAGDTRLEA